MSGVLRYEARTAADREVPQPVALWLDGSTLRLTGVEPERVDAVQMELVIPPELDLDVRVSDSTVSVRSLYGDLVLAGERIRLEAFDLRGAADLTLRGGELSIRQLSGDVALAGTELRAELAQVGGSLAVELEGGALRIEDAPGSVTGELEGTAVHVDGVGTIELTVGGGRVEMSGVRKSAQLRLTDTELLLGKSRGQLSVESDGLVRFSGVESRLQIVSHGGRVQGAESTGELHIETLGGEVALEKIRGPATIIGDGLSLSVEEVEAPLTVQVTSSDVTVAKALKPVRIENDFGDVTIRETSEQVHVVSKNGAVRATALAGPIELHADGHEVEVAWSQLGTGDSVVMNASGGVRATIPQSSQCQVQVHGGAGVRSDLAEIVVAPDGNSASGTMNGGLSPSIDIRAGGAVELLAAQ
jgi:hypothetical protein